MWSVRVCGVCCGMATLRAAACDGLRGGRMACRKRYYDEREATYGMLQGMRRAAKGGHEGGGVSAERAVAWGGSAVGATGGGGGWVHVGRRLCGRLRVPLRWSLWGTGRQRVSLLL